MKFGTVRVCVDIYVEYGKAIDFTTYGLREEIDFFFSTPVLS